MAKPDLQKVYFESTARLMKDDGEGSLATLLSGIKEAADDTAATNSGIPIGGIYRTGSAIKVRVV